PNFVSWIDGDGAFPEWRISFGHFSRLFFASIFAGLFLLLFAAVFSAGLALIQMIGDSFSYIFRWIFRNFVLFAFAVWNAVFYWAARTRKLLDALEQYVLAIFSCLLPLLSIFTLVFIAALPMGIDRLWRRGFSSGILLGILLTSGLCVFAGWQGGIGSDGKPHEPFYRPVNILVKIALALLPIFCPLLVHTIGLRVNQYGLTVDRIVSMTLAVAFGLWSLAWAFFLVRHKLGQEWPVFYGKVNRIAFPTLAVVLILLASPLCDVRKIVLRERLDRLRESVRQGGDIEKTDWRYIVRDLGIYGIRAMEELGASSDAEIRGKIGPFAESWQAAKIRNSILIEIASVKKGYAPHGKSADANGARDQEAVLEDLILNDWILSAKNAPVFGGELGPDERERLVRQLPKESVNYSAVRRNARIGFFYLEDMDGDGEKEIMLELGKVIYLFHDNRALEFRSVGARKSGGKPNVDDVTTLSANEQRIIRNQWYMLRINDRIFFLDPNDVEEIAPVLEMSRE
ncbi:MAG: DUF4153 domain-containing protein, partial [Synergistaceae bacterium]|nr:DUF4153 domain-containing protein [Synergistaceae bacterium]